jgi:hypothetical protein
MLGETLQNLKWDPCHHGVADPQVAAGGDSLHIWRVYATIMNKQSLTDNKGWSSNLRVQWVAKTPHHKN